MTVLFAVKMTEPAEVCHAVEDFARSINATLLVLHVSAPASNTPYAIVDPMTGLGDLTSYTLFDPEIQESLEEAEQQAFQSFLARSFRRPVQTSVRRGGPAQTILDDAAEHDVDFIVVGKRHHGRIEKFLMGDTATEVVEHADRPVLLMPLNLPL